ncbi:DNA translocase FtsK [Patescibacteria group bacterium]|nr:DNA translocase FtsK [Patescibacteria group bacterium]MBU4368127.1 DNA translocase FtsK [Patescibacteria group bacterium]
MAKNKKNNGKNRDFGRVYLRKEIKYNIIAIIFFTLAVITLLSFIGAKDSFGDKIFRGAGLLFGNLFFLVPVILFIAGLSFLAKISKGGGEAKFYYQQAVLFGACLFFLSALALVNLVFYPDNFLSAAKNYSGGGYAGLILAYPLDFFFGAMAAKVVLLALIVVSFLFIFNLSLELFFAKAAYAAKAFYNYYRFLSYRDRKAREVESENYADNLDKEPKDSFVSRAIKKIISIPSFKVKTISGKTPGAAGFSVEAKNETSPIAGDIAGKEKSFANGKLDIEIKENKRPPKPKEAWVKFPLALLDGGFSQANSGDINANVSIIEKTLANFGIEVEMGKVYIGPTVTQYTLRPAVGVKLSQITALANDLALSLAARSIRIEAPIPGKSLVGIEIPNVTAATVRLKNILENFPKKDYFSDLSVAMGLDVSGGPYWLDISKAPHLLIAGSTGSGKTISINSLIMSLIYNNPPETLKFILIDPKRVELTLYNGIPHLLTPVIVEVEKAVSALKWAIGEMERRYLLLQELASRDIDSYNQKILSAKEESLERMPFIMIVIDELADLMATFPREIEAAIVRLSQMSRAVGIHLVVSTQRPSVDVITGLIKANITSRVAFRVASLIDSRTILDHSGAEKLLGRGDMLFLATGASKPKRLQGCFVSEAEVKKVVNWFKENYDSEAKAIKESELKSPAANLFGEKISGGIIDDEMYEEAKEVVVRAQKASASLLQRRLRVGYARAARLLDLLEEAGIIGPADGAKPRQILAGQPQDAGANLVNSGEEEDSKIVDGNI